MCVSVLPRAKKQKEMCWVLGTTSPGGLLKSFQETGGEGVIVLYNVSHKVFLQKHQSRPATQWTFDYAGEYYKGAKHFEKRTTLFTTAV